MIVINTKKKDTGVWFKFTLRGEEVEFKIRPLSPDVFDDVRRKHRIVKMERDPQTRQMVRVEHFDDEAIMNEIIDYILEDFKNFVDENGNPLPNTVEYKRLIFQIPPTADETISVADFIFEKARELSALSEERYKELEKNWLRLQLGDIVEVA